jgi:hypothetical protein
MKSKIFLLSLLIIGGACSCRKKPGAAKPPVPDTVSVVRPFISTDVSSIGVSGGFQEDVAFKSTVRIMTTDASNAIIVYSSNARFFYTNQSTTNTPTVWDHTVTNPSAVSYWAATVNLVWLDCGWPNKNGTTINSSTTPTTGGASDEYFGKSPILQAPQNITINTADFAASAVISTDC